MVTKPSLIRNSSQLPFLEPPHSHDPTSVSCVAALPVNIISQLPDKIQNSLWELQQSASVAYASFCRLQDLLDERFERLLPSVGAGGPTFSETSFYTYRSHLRAEKTYLVSNAFPDWRHKASLATAALRPFGDMSFSTMESETSMTVNEWWTLLQSTVSSWRDYAKDITIPDFDDTVQEYLTTSHRAIVDDSEESTPLYTPTTTYDPHGSIFTTELSKLEMSEKTSALSDTSVRVLEIRKDSGVGVGI